jgi:outer membrane immunogenic protein
MPHIRNYFLAGAAGVAMACTQAAVAADIPGRQAYPPPPPVPYFVPAFNWTGFYVGGNLGYGWGKGDGDITVAGVGTGPIESDGNGFLGGVQAGYNVQMGTWVFGGEGDFQGSAAKGDLTGSPGAATLTGESETPWFGTLRGRIGYASDRWMGYVTGGAVYGETKVSGSVSGPGGGTFDASATYWSWTVGGGVEYALWDRWSTKVEYLYLGSPSELPEPVGARNVEMDFTSHIVRAGLNYRF